MAAFVTPCLIGVRSIFGWRVLERGKNPTLAPTSHAITFARLSSASQHGELC